MPVPSEKCADLLARLDALAFDDWNELNDIHTRAELLADKVAAPELVVHDIRSALNGLNLAIGYGGTAPLLWSSTAATLVRSLTLVQEQLEEDEVAPSAGKGDDPEDAMAMLERVFERFHAVALQLTARHDGRPSLKISDEYDVQDLLGGLLKLFFDDIRPEESNPSHGGGSTRSDFLLKNEKIVIEVKKTRSGLRDKKVAEQLTIDRAYYQTHPDCESLVCFVYDPEHLIANAEGIRADLEAAAGLPWRIFIRPLA